MTSYVENETEVKFDFDIKKILDQVMTQILDQEKCPYEAQVNLLVTDNEGIREYNRKYREIDAATDVLSFPMLSYETEADFSAAEAQEADCFDPETGELMLGDIIISADKVKEQAQKLGNSEKIEFAFLTAHSMLHLCVYDHMVKEEEEKMFKLQKELLNSYGIKKES